MKSKRLVVGISGSSGVILGIRLLEALRASEVETHLVITQSARLTIQQETARTTEAVEALADFHYNPRDITANIASGSFDTLGMVIIPCSIKTLSAVANCYSSDLISRAADVTLKEGRPLLLVVREAPLHAGHIHLLDQAARSGAIIFPPVPAFYTHPHSLDEMVDNIVGRVLRRMGIENELYKRWQGVDNAAPAHVETVYHAKENPDLALLRLPAMTLATSSADGEPHAATVYFASAAEKGAPLYFFSDLNSQHSRDLAHNPRAAASIHPLVEGWQEIQGLQLRGTVSAVKDDAEWRAAWDLYRAKFPFVDGLKDTLAKNTLYALTPQWTRLIDNERGFGFKQEWTRP